MKYCIEYTCFPEELEALVNARIAVGWTVQGGVCVHKDCLYQAMTKEDEAGWVDLAPMVTQEFQHGSSCYCTACLNKRSEATTGMKNAWGEPL